MTKQNTEKTVALRKLDSAKRLVYGVVLVPEVEDAQGDIVSAEEIEKAAHNYLRAFRVVGDSHEVAADAEVVESYVAPVDISLGGQTIEKGSWVMAVKVNDEKMWEAVQKDEYTGFSIGGEAYRDEVP